MRFKRIGLIFTSTFLLVGLGMLIGFWLHYRTFQIRNEERIYNPDSPFQKYVSETKHNRNEELSASRFNPNSKSMYENGVDVAGYEETLSVDTDYIVVEHDVLRGQKTEIQKDLPDMYYGMNRQQFTDAMKAYAMSVPLSEREHGFIGLEVQSFSASRVVVRMDYRYVSPDTIFILKVVNGEVVVFLEDQQTIYMNTGILYDLLPDTIKEQIRQNLCLNGERELYSFLEAYTS